VDGWIRAFAAQYEARNLGLPAIRLSQQLIEARAGANLPAGCDRRTGEQIAGLLAMDISFASLGVK